jgi:carboxypeptidase Q
VPASSPVIVLEAFTVRIRTRAAIALPVVCLIVTLPGRAQTDTPPESVDYDAIYKIKEEGFQRSKAMEIASYLTDVYGPRLTGSPNIRQAADWAVKQLREWGASNPRIESWGTFGRGWINERFSAQVLTPTPWPIIGMPKAWTPGTGGAVTADVVYAPMETEKDFDTWKGRLKGKIVMPMPTRTVKAHFEALAERYTDKELDDLQQIEPRGDVRRRYDPAQFQFARKRLDFLVSEGVLATFEPGRGDGGTLFVQQGGAYSSAPPSSPYGPRFPATVPPQVVIAVEHYGRLARTLDKTVPVTVELNVQNRFIENQPGFNVLAELPGTDKPDEVVMLGAHFDSWHGATGATDNGVGSAIVLEVMRILKATGLQLRRTVRLGLWGGEEQGLLGSKAYVKQTFADRETMALEPEHAKFAGYFNVDNGTGAIRGVYLQGNEAVAPIFSAWMKPFANLGMTTLSLRNTGGTDHLSFDAVGLPGFQFIQDPLEYDTRTHHSNMDNYERLQADDVMKNAVIVASFVYHAANRDAKLPRKPLPKPQPVQPQAPAAVTTNQ